MIATTSKTKRKIAIQDIDGFKFTNVSDLVYCESTRKGTSLFFNSGHTILSSRGLYELESELVPLGFFRIHKSFLVNLDYISAVSGGEKSTVSLFDGTVLSVSARKKKSFMDQFTKV
ncbi:MAG: Two component transcriptional regulator, LytTR family [Candidatus Moranbacteria bacterium GW2011_GWF2_36_839]|nr:MAG: Two component transcriptional regulator, LytTR family [Candidatus Moranbacteria bacterium GW2011_GWF2_36_839]